MHNKLVCAGSLTQIDLSYANEAKRSVKIQRLAYTAMAATMVDSASFFLSFLSFLIS